MPGGYGGVGLSINGVAAFFNLLCQGRLTLASGDPCSISNQVDKTTLYFTPYGGNNLTLYTSGAWKLYTFTELSLALAGLTAGKNYDVYVYDVAGAATLALGAAWTDDTTRSEALALQDGVRVLGSNHAKKYVGTIRATDVDKTQDSALKRFTLNWYNRCNRHLANTPGYVDDNAYTTYVNAGLVWNAIKGTEGRLEFLCNGEDAPYVAYNAYCATDAAAGAGIGVGIDSTTQPFIASIVLAATSMSIAQGIAFPRAEGYHKFEMLTVNTGAVATGVTFAADMVRLGAATDPPLTGISALVRA